MTYHDQDRRYYENEPSHREDQRRYWDRGQHREGRSFERGPDSATERDFGRGAGREQEREFRGGTRHHSSRPYLQREFESERYGDDFQSGQRGWGERSGGGEGGRSFGMGAVSASGYGAGSYAGGNFGGGSFGGGSYGGSNYGGSSFGTGEGSGYGAGTISRRSEREEGQRSWQGSGSSLQRNWDGPYAGKGPKGFRRSDERLHEETCDQLERNGQLDASEIEVTCKDGIVTLRGTVDSRRAKRLAEETAEQVYGVQDVMNELKIQKDQRDSGTERSGQYERSASSRLDPSRQESTHAGQSSTSTSTSQKR
jgi:osmotically-inducible protein OsmY